MKTSTYLLLAAVWVSLRALVLHKAEQACDSVVARVPMIVDKVNSEIADHMKVRGDEIAKSVRKNLENMDIRPGTG